MRSRSVLSADTDMGVPEYHGLSLVGRYLFILGRGFLNTAWMLTLAGVIAVWASAAGKAAPAKRTAVALSLMIAHYWLLLTLVFLFLFSNMRT